MELVVTGRHIDITPPIREYAEQKVSKLPRYFDRVTSIEVVADKSKHHHNDHQVEIIVSAEKTANFIAHANGSDLYACIDEAVDKLERQLRDHKEKLRNNKHKVHRP